MKDIINDFLSTVEGKQFKPEWIPEFTLVIQLPDIPLFEQLAYQHTSIGFEYINDKSRRIYNLCGPSSDIADLLMKYGHLLQSNK